MTKTNSKYEKIKKEIKKIMEYLLDWISRFLKIVAKYTIAFSIMFVGIGIAMGISRNSLPSKDEVAIVRNNIKDSEKLYHKSKVALDDLKSIYKRIDPNKLDQDQLFFFDKMEELSDLNKDLAHSSKTLVDTNSLLLSHADSGILMTFYMHLLSFFIGIGSSIAAHAVIKTKSYQTNAADAKSRADHTSIFSSKENGLEEL